MNGGIAGLSHVDTRKKWKKKINFIVQVCGVLGIECESKTKKE